MRRIISIYSLIPCLTISVRLVIRKILEFPCCIFLSCLLLRYLPKHCIQYCNTVPSSYCGSIGLGKSPGTIQLQSTFPTLSFFTLPPLQQLSFRSVNRPNSFLLQGFQPDHKCTWNAVSPHFCFIFLFSFFIVPFFPLLFKYSCLHFPTTTTPPIPTSRL